METSLFLNKLDPQKIKKCPACRSIYVTDFECEACGLQLNHSKIGLPFGSKSFYALCELHPHKGLFEAFFPESKKMFDRKLLRRYRELTSYFISGGDKNQRLFQVELTDIVRTLVDRKVDSEKILGHLDSRLPIYQKIARLVFINSTKRSIAQRFFDFRLFGAIRLSALLVEMLILSTFIVGALAYYRFYFAIR